MFSQHLQQQLYLSLLSETSTNFFNVTTTIIVYLLNKGFNYSLSLDPNCHNACK